jgi:hypothetical protein
MDLTLGGIIPYPIIEGGTDGGIYGVVDGIEGVEGTVDGVG